MLTIQCGHSEFDALHFIGACDRRGTNFSLTNLKWKKWILYESATYLRTLQPAYQLYHDRSTSNCTGKIWKIAFKSMIVMGSIGDEKSVAYPISTFSAKSCQWLRLSSVPLYSGRIHGNVSDIILYRGKHIKSIKLTCICGNSSLRSLRHASKSEWKMYVCGFTWHDRVMVCPCMKSTLPVHHGHWFCVQLQFLHVALVEKLIGH